MYLKIKRLVADAILPSYQHRGEDAGLDLYACEEKIIKPRQYQKIGTGIAIELEKNHVAYINPRSGLALKYGVTVLNASGVIDPGYRGEIGVILINHGSEDFVVKKGARIAQMIIHAFVEVQWQEVEELGLTQRDKKGFGDSGII